MTTLAQPSAAHWVCLRCHADIPMSVNACGQCGWSMRDETSPSQAHQEKRQFGRLRTAGLAVKELVIVNILFVVWRLVGDHSLLHSGGAQSRGLDIWRAERWLHLPSEKSVQALIVNHEELTRAADEFYAWAHIASIVVFLAWLWWRHRDRYAGWRNILVAFTGISLLIGWLPVAPPRLLHGIGLVDTASRDHTSVYQGIGKGITDQLSAMPSVHVGWALLIAIAVISVSTSKWRWAIIAHPIVTTFVVVATANHYWADGVAAAVILLAILALARIPAISESRLLRNVQLPGRLGERAADRGIDREGLGELIDGEVVLHGQ